MKNPKTKPDPRRLAKPADPPGYRSRLVAARALRRILRERRPIDEALDLENGPVALSPADAGLVRAILAVSLRRLGSLRAALRALATDGALPEAGLVEPALITAAAQVLFLDVPDHAAVDCAVEIAKRDPDSRPYARLVNALLRRIAAGKAGLLARIDSGLDDTPGWLLERWSRFYGPDAAADIARIHRSEPPIDLTTFAPLSPGIAGTLLPTGSFRLATSAPIASLPGYAEGVFQVQDVAAALPARLIGATPGMRIADFCAAPGGKTAQLAASGAEVVAIERSAARAQRLRENLARLQLRAEIVVGDALEFRAEAFDAILIDAPCSATGTIRRHPEIAWTRTLSDVFALANQQARLLQAAAELIRPGGVLVFATCSLEHEEGEAQIETFLATRPEFHRQPIEAAELGVPKAMRTSEGDLRVLPSHLAEWGGADGFYAARLQRLA